MKKIFSVLCTILAFGVVLLIVVHFLPAPKELDESAEPAATAETATRAVLDLPEIGADELPPDILSFVENVNAQKPDPDKQLGVGAPFQAFEYEYFCGFDSLLYQFRDNDRFISVSVSSVRPAHADREGELKDEYDLICRFLFSEQTAAEAPWGEIVSEERCAREKVSIQYIRGEREDFLILLIPNE